MNQTKRAYRSDPTDVQPEMAQRLIPSGPSTGEDRQEHTEETLRATSERLDLALRGSNVGIWEIDMPGGDYRNGRVHYVNVWEQLGYDGSRSPTDHATWRALWHPEDQLRVERALQSYLAGETKEFEVEYRVRHRDGSYRWVLSRGVAVRDATGRPIRLVGSRFDITDLKRAEEALRESEERFRDTFQNAAVGMAHLDTQGRFLRVNEKLCEIVGYTREELLAKTFQEITCPDDLAASLDLFTPLIRGALPSFSREKRYIRKDGSLVWVAISVSLQRDAAGMPANTISIVQDISGRKRLEEELRQAKDAAEAANRAKDEFLANVSHEIRTPMNAILGMTELVLDTRLTDDQRQSLRTVKSAADNLLGIIDDLLDFSKIEAGKFDLDSADFSLRAVLGDTMRAMAVRAHRKGLELVCQVQPAVADALVGDAGRLRQILLNLVGNAVKFTDTGEVVVRVEAAGGAERALGIGDRGAEGEERQRATSDSQNPIPNPQSLIPPSHSLPLRFTVRDTGIGIPRDRQERIFLAFEQADTSTTRKYGGTGLGLTIAARLVALMGGKITVESVPGQGSTFAFTAWFGLQPHQPEPPGARPPRDLFQPVEREEPFETIYRVENGPIASGDNAAPADSLLGCRESAPASNSVTSPLRILVAEDNEFNSRLLKQLLVRRGHGVWLASDGREALSLAEGEAFDLLLLDVHMPELDGFQVVQTIRRRERVAGGHLPIIALTARSREEDRRQRLAAGMDDFLAKPIHAANLWEAIDRVVTARPGPNLLDPGVLLAACGGDAVILEKICQAFRARVPDHLAALRGALRDGDASRLREAAHRFSGMVAAFSSIAGRVASDVEDHVACGQLDEARPMVEQLETMVHDIARQTVGLSVESLRHDAEAHDGREGGS